MVTVDIREIMFILVFFEVKHYIADYPLQFPFMVDGKAKMGLKWVYPLTLHCLIHSLFTLLLALFINPTLWWVFLVDFVSHFVMDRIKSSPVLLGKWRPSQRAFWITLGFDQMVHHLVQLWIVWRLLI